MLTQFTSQAWFVKSQSVMTRRKIMTCFFAYLLLLFISFHKNNVAEMAATIAGA